MCIKKPSHIFFTFLHKELERKRGREPELALSFYSASWETVSPSEFVEGLKSRGGGRGRGCHVIASRKR